MNLPVNTYICVIGRSGKNLDFSNDIPTHRHCFKILLNAVKCTNGLYCIGSGSINPSLKGEKLLYNSILFFLNYKTQSRI